MQLADLWVEIEFGDSDAEIRVDALGGAAGTSFEGDFTDGGRSQEIGRADEVVGMPLGRWLDVS
jgi:hypothetical protein